MPTSRREFLKQLGAGAATLAAAWILEGCRATGIPTATTTGASPTRLPSPISNPKGTFSLQSQRDFQSPTPNIQIPTSTPPLLPIAVRLTADASRVVGRCDSKLWGNLGFDPMYSHTVAPTTQPVWEMIRASRAFHYIRCHNTFSDAAPNARPENVMGCRVYAEDANGAPRYAFQYLDSVLDLWTRAGLKPILEMDFMPDALADGAIVRNYGGGAINAPRDYARWREMIYQTVKHLVERYGADEVRSWYFEIWNEPDLSVYFIDGILGPGKFTPERIARFNKMYDYFVDGAVAADEQIQVGGPGLAGHDDFFRLFLDHITNGTNAVTGQRGTRADFISWHGYGASEQVMQRNRARRALVKNYPALANAELHQNEWGQTLHPGTPEDGTSPTVLGEYDAAFLCRAIDNMFSNEDARVDLFLRWGQMVNGWRAQTRQFGGVTAPLAIFNAYTLLAKLGPERIAFENVPNAANVRGFAARRGAAAQVVVYRLDEKNLDGNGEVVGVEMMLKGTGGSPTTKIYRIDREHANAYRAWVALGSPKAPTNAQAAEIFDKSKLVPETISAVEENGAAKISLAMPPNAMALIVLGEE